MRLRQHCAIATLAIAALIMVPREAAAFWDWIHELSGPSMIGVGYTCRPFKPRLFSGNSSADKPQPLSEQATAAENADTAQLAASPIGPAFSFDRCFGESEGPNPQLNFSPARAHWWTRYEAYLYFSVKHEDDPRGPPVFAVSQSLLFETSPVYPGRAGQNVLFVGAGPECFAFFGEQFKAFARCALKLRPVGIRFNADPGERLLGAKALEVAFDVRYFPSEFIPQDFGVKFPREQRRGGEVTLGALFSIVFR